MRRICKSACHISLSLAISKEKWTASLWPTCACVAAPTSLPPQTLQYKSIRLSLYARCSFAAITTQQLCNLLVIRATLCCKTFRETERIEKVCLRLISLSRGLDDFLTPAQCTGMLASRGSVLWIIFYFSDAP